MPSSIEVLSAYLPPKECCHGRRASVVLARPVGTDRTGAAVSYERQLPARCLSQRPYDLRLGSLGQSRYLFTTVVSRRVGLQHSPRAGLSA